MKPNMKPWSLDSASRLNWELKKSKSFVTLNSSLIKLMVFTKRRIDL